MNQNEINELSKQYDYCDKCGGLHKDNQPIIGHSLSIQFKYGLGKGEFSLNNGKTLIDSDTLNEYKSSLRKVLKELAKFLDEDKNIKL